MVSINCAPLLFSLRGVVHVNHFVFLKLKSLTKHWWLYFFLDKYLVRLFKLALSFSDVLVVVGLFCKSHQRVDYPLLIIECWVSMLHYTSCQDWFELRSYQSKNEYTLLLVEFFYIFGEIFYLTLGPIP